jgi:betaine reductase
MSDVEVAGFAFCLAHVPDLVKGDNCPIGDAVWDYDQVCAYVPNQACIGGIDLEALALHPRPWRENPICNAGRWGKFGEIMPQEEFLALLQICDSFGFVSLEEVFAQRSFERLAAHPLMSGNLLAKLRDGCQAAEIEEKVRKGALPIRSRGEVVGCVRDGGDPFLSPLLLLENLSCKAIGALSLLHLLSAAGLSPDDLDYAIESSMCAAGDGVARGCGGFARACAEVLGCSNAGGCDIRASEAGPAAGVIAGAAQVACGLRRNVAIIAGSSFSELHRSSFELRKKGLPMAGDCIGGVAIILTPAGGRSPILRLDAVGRLPIGVGSSPRVLVSHLVFDPLDRAGLSASSVDKYAVCLSNPEICAPLGLGDPAEDSVKMIAASASMRGEIERGEVEDFVKRHGTHGFISCGGPLASGVSYLGHFAEAASKGKARIAMVVGKGSLFPSRLTNQVEGVSFIVEFPA